MQGDESYVRGHIESIFRTWPFGQVYDVNAVNCQVFIVTAQQGTYVLKRKADLRQVTRERKLLEYLHGRGVRAHQISGQFETEGGEVYCLYAFVPGEVLNKPQGYGRQIGEEIGRLHIAFSNYECVHHFRERTLFDVIYGWVLKSIEESRDARIQRVAALLCDIRHEIGILNDLPRQLIHRDAHAGNMMFHHGQFTGFVDFDLVETNLRLFDPCYCSMYILPDRFETEGFKEEWLDFLGSILSAYHGVNPLKPQERRAVWFVLIAIEALFVALFANSDPNAAAKNAEMCMWMWYLRQEIEHVVSINIG